MVYSEDPGIYGRNFGFDSRYSRSILLVIEPVDLLDPQTLVRFQHGTTLLVVSDGGSIPSGSISGGRRQLIGEPSR